MALKKQSETTETNHAFDISFDQSMKLSTLYLHQAMTSSGLPVERTISKTKFKDIELAWTGTEVLAKWKGKRILIPAANVANAIVMD